ncbi:MAG TPA: hypothetical protein VF121_00110 [Thermoanaerobaculia bacterium]|nr:hypothetical protein [Thermoanaerobaculia bacterium]
MTGSIATVFYGEPRFTNDIDIVVDLPLEQVGELCRAFPSDQFYVDEESARAAVERRGQFNVIHPASGLKLDLVVPTADEFDRSRFRRTARLHPAADYEASFASAEDVILKKLDFYRRGGSEKHLRDIAGVLRISGDRLDTRYLEEWAARLGLAEIWQAVRVRHGR